MMFEKTSKEMMLGDGLKVWRIRTKAAKDGRGCERTFKAVSRALEDVWRVPKGSVCQRIDRFINSFNTGQDQ